MRKYRNMGIISILILAFLSTFSCADSCGDTVFDGFFADDDYVPPTHLSTAGSATWNIGYLDDSSPSNFLSIDSQQSVELNSQQYLLIDFIFDMTLSRSEDINTWRFPSLIQKAYACSPAPFDQYYNNIEEIIITSDQDFNAQYPAGSNLNDLFDVARSGYYSSYIDEDSVMTLTQYLLQDPQEVERLALKLTQRPALDNQHTFKVSYLNELGNFMLFESPGVIFSNENN